MTDEASTHTGEEHGTGIGRRLNWLRAGVLGANDGIVSVAALAELALMYRERGLTEETAQRVAVELTAHDALAAHLEVELHIDQNDLVSPWQAAASSALAFTLGALLPLLAILLPAPEWRVPVTFVAVLIALGLTGTIAARLGGASAPRAATRLVAGGALALAATYALGALLDTAGVV